jgi:transcriptional regulator with XRE-family HTH domain
MQIYEKIRFLRQMRGWSQEDMANKLEMSPGGYANIERGETDVQISRLEKIAQNFDMDLMELVSFGEKNVIHIINGENGRIGSTFQNVTTQKDLVSEIDKLNFMVEQKDKEIQYLKDIIELLKMGKAV